MQSRCVGIWAASIRRCGVLNRSKTPSAQKCNPCLRYVLLPMCPGRTRAFWRRRGDSNPRDPFEPNGFQDRRFQPLTHSSALILAYSALQFDGNESSPCQGCGKRQGTWAPLRGFGSILQHRQGQHGQGSCSAKRQSSLRQIAQANENGPIQFGVAGKISPPDFLLDGLALRSEYLEFVLTVSLKVGL